MNLCSDGHEEVCYEARTCPCCETIQMMKDDLSDKDIQIEDLKDQVDDMKQQLKEREQEL